MDGREAGGKVAEDEARAFDFGEGGGGGGNAKPGGDEPHFGLDVVGVLGDAGLGPGAGARSEEGIVVPMLDIGIHHDEGFFIEIGPIEFSFFGEAMAGWKGQDLPGFLDEFEFELGVTDRRAKEAGIEFVLPQAADLFDAGEVEEGELDLGELLLKAAEDIGEPWIGGGGDNAEAQSADETGFGLAGALFGIGGRVEDITRFGEEDAAGKGEFDLTRGALEQGNAEVFLQGTDLGAEGGLGDVKFLGGAAEIEFLGKGGEVAKVSQFHGLIVIRYQ